MNTAFLPLISQLEEVIIAELDRQYLNGQIEPSSSGEPGFFSSVDGEINGLPDWFSTARAVFKALEDGGLIA